MQYCTFEPKGNLLDALPGRRKLAGFLPYDRCARPQTLDRRWLPRRSDASAAIALPARPWKIDHVHDDLRTVCTMV